MSTPSTGQIKFSDMVSEFGQPPDKNLGGYRVSQSIAGRNWTLDSGVPTSGQIKFSDMMGKTLNVVVDLSGGEEYNVDTGAKYDSSGQAVGGFRSIPGRLSSSTKKVHVIVRKTVGGSLGDGVALRSGTWNTSALSLNYIITSSGKIIGRGGNGGAGANIDESAPSADTSFYSSKDPNNTTRYGAQSGGHAMVLTYPSAVNVESGGVLAGGGGGGGGGGYKYNSGPDARGAGYGGGGGAGLPAGSGGLAGFVNNGGSNNNVCQGGPGGSATLTSGGVGGPVNGNFCGLTGGGHGGGGGSGGNWGVGGNSGENQNTLGGSGGSAGNAIYHPSITVSVNNAGTISGSY